MEYYLGQIILFPYNYVPQGFLACNGQSLQVAQNQTLFSLLGTRFGGNTTAFNLPDLRGAEPVPGLTYCIAIQGEYPMRP